MWRAALSPLEAENKALNTMERAWEAWDRRIRDFLRKKGRIAQSTAVRFLAVRGWGWGGLVLGGA